MWDMYKKVLIQEFKLICLICNYVTTQAGKRRALAKDKRLIGVDTG